MNHSKHTLIPMITILFIALLIFTACIREEAVPPVGENNAPSAVINIYPLLSELVDENNFYAKWTKSVDPEGQDITYIVNFAKTMEGLDDPQYYETKDNYFLMPSLSEGVWYWQVTAKDTGGKQTPSPIWNFTINGEGLPQPVNPEEIPPDPVLILSQVENTSFTLDWPAYEDKQNPSNIIQYTINVYEKNSLTEIRNEQDIVRWLSRIEPATTAHTTDTIHTFNNLKSVTYYEWVIIAQNNASQTSVVGSSGVKTGNRSPTQPELISPTDSATNVATDVALSWSACTDPDGDSFKYYVYIDTVKNTNRNVTVEGINETNYQPEGLEKGRTYYWFILVKDDNGAATRTSAQTFMTQSDGMDIPHTPSPTDGSQDIDALDPPLLQWEHNKNNQAITYSVYFSSNPKSISLATQDLNQQQYQIPEALQGNTTYYWQVEAVNTQTAKTTKSGVWTFKTQIIPSPTQTNAQTNREGTQIELTYNKAMADPAGKHDQYTVKKTTQNEQNNREEQTLTTTKIELKPGTNNQYLLSLETPVQNTDEITIDYTQGTIQAQDGTFLESYTDKPVTNQVPGQKPIVETAIINSAGQTIDIGFNKAMEAPTGTEYEQFGVLVNGFVNEITAAELKTDDTEHLLLTLKYPIGKNNQVHVSYTRGTIQSSDGAYLESFQNKLVNTDNLEVLWVVKNIGWNYSTIQSAIDGAEEEATVMVWPGRYMESLTINKPVHLMSSNPASETVQANTIIDANEALFAVQIESQANTGHRGASPEGTVTIEGFTITNAMGASSSSGERPVSEAAGIIVNNMNTEIKNNIITKNGTDTSDKGTRGIYVGSQDADVKIHDNTISDNTYTVSYDASMERSGQPNEPGGAGIYVYAGSPEIYQNTLSNNSSDGNGGAIAVGNEAADISSRIGGVLPVIYNNTITANSAKKGGGIFVSGNAEIKNADGQSWNRFNAPNASEAFVEGNELSSNNNTYTGNTLLVTSSTRNGVQEGANICFESQQTGKGTLTLRPEQGVEKTLVTLNIDYLIATQFKGGTLTIAVPTGFEITDNASVTIGEDDPKAASVYSPTEQRIDITAIDLEEGTITLKLIEQEVPDGVEVEQNAMRNVDYTLTAYGDADGSASAWTPTEASTAVFTSTPLSTNTDFTLTGDDPQLIQYKSDLLQPVAIQSRPTLDATVLKVASETTVETVLNNITNVDGATQTYKICNNNHPSGLVGTHQLTAEATLVVTSEHGAPYEHEYAIEINETPFVRLEKTQENVSSSRNNRNGVNILTSWGEDVNIAVTNASENAQSTITVWPGYYVESLLLETKPIHLTSATPTDETVRNSTIIDGNESSYVVYIGAGPQSSQRIDEQSLYTIVEGFTIKNAMGSSDASSERGGSPSPGCGILIEYMNAIIRNNFITENGTNVSNKGARGLFVSAPTSDVKIHNNIISHNSYLYTFGSMSRIDIQWDGAGIYVETGRPEIYDNVIDNNTSDGNGGGICLGQASDLSSSRNDRGEPTTDSPVVYGNTISNNTAANGAGIYVCSSMNIKNADGELWKRFNRPNATVDFVEHNDTEENNTYSDNQLTQVLTTQRNGTGEGEDICFEPQQTAAGTLETSPATALVDEDFTFMATYTFDGDTYDASMTFELPAEMDLSEDASITIDGSKQSLSTVEFDAGTGKVFVTSITGTDPQVVLELNQNSKIEAGEYTLKAIADADGTRTAHAPSNDSGESDIASSTLIIEVDGIFTLEKVDSSKKYETFYAAFNDIGDSETATISTSESTEIIVEEQIEIEWKDIRIKPAEGATITFKGNGEDHRIFWVFGEDSSPTSLTLYNTVVRNGKNETGAGFFVRKAHLQLENCQIIYNECNDNNHYGAGIYMVTNSTANIQNTLIASNTNTAGLGGGIFVSGSSATITGSTVSYNKAPLGGGINVYNSLVSITDTVVGNNNANEDGGGIYLSIQASELELTNSTITSNTANTNGGGIYLQDGKITLENCFIENNYSNQNGGGIYMTPSLGLPNLYFDSGHIRSNTADGDGGGIYRNGGYVYTGVAGQWDFVKNPYNANFSVDTSGNMDDYLLHPAKVYDNFADGNGQQMIW